MRDDILVGSNYLNGVADECQKHETASPTQ